MVYEFGIPAFETDLGDAYGVFKQGGGFTYTGRLLGYLQEKTEVEQMLAQDASYIDGDLRAPKEKEEEMKSHIGTYQAVLNYLSHNVEQDFADFYTKRDKQANKHERTILTNEKDGILQIYSQLGVKSESLETKLLEEKDVYDRTDIENELALLARDYGNNLAQQLDSYLKTFEKVTYGEPVTETPVEAPTEREEKSALDNPYSNPVSQGIENGVGYTWDTVKAPLRPFGRDVKNGIQAVANSYRTPDIKESKSLAHWMYQQGRMPSEYFKGVVDGKNELQQAINETDRIVANSPGALDIIASGMGFGDLF